MNSEGESKDGTSSSEGGSGCDTNQKRPESEVTDHRSMKSARSASEPIDFEKEDESAQQTFGDTSPGVPSDNIDLNAYVDSAYEMLELDAVAFVKTELRRFKTLTFRNSPGNCDDEEQLVDEEEQRNREAFLKMTTSFLKRRNKPELANFLESGTPVGICRQKLRSNLKRRYQCLYEGITSEGNKTFMNQVYAELILTGNKGAEKLSDQFECEQIEANHCKPEGSEVDKSYTDFFKLAHAIKKFDRILVTKGMAGIGKTVLTQKFTLDWAENNNPNIQLVFPVTFRELNLLNTKKIFSLVELIHYLFSETKEARILNFEDFQVLFILDGLDECRPPLDFNKTQNLTDVTESSSVHTLLVNLIRGNLLPFARLWITTRPAAANQIPAECVDIVTEIKGFTDQQKEEYFKKRFNDEEQARKIVCHIVRSRSLHVMCDIPIFCWITAAVLDHKLKEKEIAELPRTLTELYIHFLLVQVKQNSVKYHKNSEIDPVRSEETKEILLSLGKLAFEQLEKGNMIFTERDLAEYGISLDADTIVSGLLTEVSKNEICLNQEREFSFVHLSFQEFLAAFYVSVTFAQSRVNLLRKRNLAVTRVSKYKQFYKSAVDSALLSSSGHLDMFVRFLLGLSLETNQALLQRLMKKVRGQPQVRDTVVKYIKKKLRDSPSVEKSIHLFYWLNEMNEHSLEREIRQYLSSENISEKKLTLSQWSTLAFILVSSQEDLNVFDLKKFSSSKEALAQLLPVVKVSQKSLLSSCGLSWKSCIYLLPALTSEKSSLRDLDLSDNDLKDTGVQTLSLGLKNPNCRLEVLRVSGCLIDEKGCCSLASALSSNPSYLKELDLSFNHPGDTGMKCLSAGVENPKWKLKILNLDYCGKSRLQPSPLRYFRQLSLDINTASQNLRLSEDKKQVVMLKEEQTYPDVPERFDHWKQILCTEELTGRCYWEVRWKGRVNVGVAYKGIRRRGISDDGCLGWNDQSWSVFCTPQGFTAWHNNKPTDLKTVSDSNSNRVAVYLDWSAGTLSFYLLPQVISSMKRIHLHTFQSTFTESLYPAFGFGLHCDIDSPPSSVTLTSVYE